MDKAYFGGAENKVLAAIAVETYKGKVGRMRISIIEDLSSTSLHGFIEHTVEKGSIIVTDGWRGYNGISEKGYRHKVITGESDGVLPHIHTIISLDLFKNHLNQSVIVYDTTNQSHSQRMSITTMSPVRICHALERFYFGIDVFNYNSPPRKLCIICLFSFCQLMLFA